MIFKDQNGVRLILRTSVDFNSTPPASQKIKFVKPDSTASEWVAAVLTGSESTGDIFVDFSNTIKFDQAGKWTLWAELVYPDDRTGKGKKIIYFVEG